MTLAANGLGSKLKAERESRGCTLDDVSASTKIPVALLEALERDDLSRWPKGLYRRAFFRSYLTALGLRPEPLANEFARLFPDEPSLEPPPGGFAAASPHANSANEPLALMLAAPAAERVSRSFGVALVELAGVLAAAGLVSWAAGMTLLTAGGAVALVYYPFVRAATGWVRRSSNVPARAAAARSLPALSPSAETGVLASRKVRQRALQHLRSGLTPARIRLAHLRAYAARKWLPLTKRISRTASQGLWRAGTRAGRVLRHGVEATFHASRASLPGRAVSCGELAPERGASASRCRGDVSGVVARRYPNERFSCGELAPEQGMSFVMVPRRRFTCLHAS